MLLPRTEMVLSLLVLLGACYAGSAVTVDDFVLESTNLTTHNGTAFVKSYLKLTFPNGTEGRMCRQARYNGYPKSDLPDYFLQEICEDHGYSTADNLGYTSYGYHSWMDAFVVQGCGQYDISGSTVSACLNAFSAYSCYTSWLIGCGCEPGENVTLGGCTTCPANMFSEAGVCEPCGVGESAAPGSSECDCPPGTARGVNGRCLPCYALWYGEDGVCMKCPEGSEDWGAGMGRCECGEGKLWDKYEDSCKEATEATEKPKDDPTEETNDNSTNDNSTHDNSTIIDDREEDKHNCTKVMDQETNDNSTENKETKNNTSGIDGNTDEDNKDQNEGNGPVDNGGGENEKQDSSQFTWKEWLVVGATLVVAVGLVLLAMVGVLRRGAPSNVAITTSRVVEDAVIMETVEEERYGIPQEVELPEFSTLTL